MLEKPDLKDAGLITSLQNDYALPIRQLTFLPLGADVNTAVYRATTETDVAYFVKLRRGPFDPTAVALPKRLSDQGIAQIIAPLPTQSGELWTRFDPFTVILYPFIAGRNGYEVALSEQQWREFGAAFKRLHTAKLPSSLIQPIPRESFPPQGRNTVRMFLSRIEQGETILDEPVAHQLTLFLQSKRTEILDLVRRAERLAEELQRNPPAFVVCHFDIHAGNLLISDPDHFYIVDWDTPLLAPKERDLMFIGGAQGFVGYSAEQEERLFYQGYGETEINPIALAYYRYERIVQDIAAYCEQLYLSPEGGEDRAQALRYVMWNFLPNATIENAYQSDRTQMKLE